jgi:Tol biopolymer transport system component
MTLYNLIRRAIWMVPLLVCTMWLLASASAFSDDGDGGPKFGPWSAPVNLGPPVNSAFAEQFPAISKDGLSLYFSCFDCPGNIGGADIWVSQRASVNDAWGTPQNLGANINTVGNDSGPALSFDEHELYFSSNRAGGFGIGNGDLYVSRRLNKRDDFGWQPAENLGSGVNTAAAEAFPEFFENDETGAITLYFQSNRPGGLGATDIYASALQADGTFGPAVLVVELSSPFEDLQPAIRRDGLEMFLASNRPGTLGNVDLWVSTRANTSDPWSTPVNLGPTVNSVFADGGPALSRNGTELYFHSPFRPGNVGGPMFDIWVSTRTKLNKPD